MTQDDMVKVARECGIGLAYGRENIERFYKFVAAAEREACAKVCDEKQTYSMPIPCPDGIEGCCVAHVVLARREKTGSECASAIRARGEA